MAASSNWVVSVAQVLMWLMGLQLVHETGRHYRIVVYWYVPVQAAVYVVQEF